jgi:thioredoxin 1
MVELNNENFTSEVLESDIPVLVDFYATWCGPCKMLSPVLESVSSDYEGKVKFAKLDTDSATETAITYGIMSIPTIIIFKNGEVSAKTVGAYGAEELTEWIDSNI